MNGRVSSQNVRKYAPRGNQPEFTYQVNESRAKQTVWMSSCGNGTVIDPFFRKELGAAYLELLNEKVLTALLNSFGNQFVNGHF